MSRLFFDNFVLAKWKMPPNFNALPVIQQCHWLAQFLSVEAALARGIESANKTTNENEESAPNVEVLPEIRADDSIGKENIEPNPQNIPPQASTSNRENTYAKSKSAQKHRKKKNQLDQNKAVTENTIHSKTSEDSNSGEITKLVQDSTENTNLTDIEKDSTSQGKTNNDNRKVRFQSPPCESKNQNVLLKENTLRTECSNATNNVDKNTSKISSTPWKSYSVEENSEELTINNNTGSDLALHLSEVKRKLTYTSDDSMSDRSTQLVRFEKQANLGLQHPALPSEVSTSKNKDIRKHNGKTTKGKENIEPQHQALPSEASTFKNKGIRKHDGKTTKGKEYVKPNPQNIPPQASNSKATNNTYAKNKSEQKHGKQKSQPDHNKAGTENTKHLKTSENSNSGKITKLVQDSTENTNSTDIEKECTSQGKTNQNNHKVRFLSPYCKCKNQNDLCKESTLKGKNKKTIVSKTKLKSKTKMDKPELCTNSDSLVPKPVDDSNEDRRENVVMIPESLTPHTERIKNIDGKDKNIAGTSNHHALANKECTNATNNLDKIIAMVSSVQENSERSTINNNTENANIGLEHQALPSEASTSKNKNIRKHNYKTCNRKYHNSKNRRSGLPKGSAKEEIENVDEIKGISEMKNIAHNNAPDKDNLHPKKSITTNSFKISKQDITKTEQIKRNKKQQSKIMSHMYRSMYDRCRDSDLNVDVTHVTDCSLSPVRLKKLYQVKENPASTSDACTSGLSFNHSIANMLSIQDHILLKYTKLHQEQHGLPDDVVQEMDSKTKQRKRTLGDFE